MNASRIPGMPFAIPSPSNGDSSPAAPQPRPSRTRTLLTALAVWALQLVLWTLIILFLSWVAGIAIPLRAAFAAGWLGYFACRVAGMNARGELL